MTTRVAAAGTDRRERLRSAGRERDADAHLRHRPRATLDGAADNRRDWIRLRRPPLEWLAEDLRRSRQIDSVPGDRQVVPARPGKFQLDTAVEHQHQRMLGNHWSRFGFQPVQPATNRRPTTASNSDSWRRSCLATSTKLERQPDIASSHGLDTRPPTRTTRSGMQHQIPGAQRWRAPTPSSLVAGRRGNIRCALTCRPRQTSGAYRAARDRHFPHALGGNELWNLGSVIGYGRRVTVHPIWRSIAGTGKSDPQPQRAMKICKSHACRMSAWRPSQTVKVSPVRSPGEGAICRPTATLNSISTSVSPRGRGRTVRGGRHGPGTRRAGWWVRCEVNDGQPTK
jgi:hypothetical protein